MKEVNKIYQIHLLLNSVMYLFESLPEDNKFLKDEQELYKHCIRLSEDLTTHLVENQNNNYTYTLSRINKLINSLKVSKL